MDNDDDDQRVMDSPRSDDGAQLHCGYLFLAVRGIINSVTVPPDAVSSAASTSVREDGTEETIVEEIEASGESGLRSTWV